MDIPLGCDEIEHCYAWRYFVPSILRQSSRSRWLAQQAHTQMRSTTMKLLD